MFLITYSCILVLILHEVTCVTILTGVPTVLRESAPSEMQIDQRERSHAWFQFGSAKSKVLNGEKRAKSGTRKSLWAIYKRNELSLGAVKFSAKRLSAAKFLGETNYLLELLVKTSSIRDTLYRSLSLKNLLNSLKTARAKMAIKKVKN